MFWHYHTGSVKEFHRGTVTPESKKELIGRHVMDNLQIDIASGATSKQADITFLGIVTILDHQMTGKINPHCRE